MIYAFIVSTLVICPQVKIENHTDVWTSYDQSVLDRSRIRCGEIYNDAPCVKRFIKKEEQLYNVVCVGGTEE